MKFGFIGAGNMGGTLLKAALKKGFLTEKEAIIYDVNDTQIAKFQSDYPVKAAENNVELVKEADVVLLGVKPVFLGGVLEEIKAVSGGKALISIAAGWSLDMINDALGEDHSAMVMRVMPNTPALVGEGYTAICEETSFTEEWIEWARAFFACSGQFATIPERLIDAVIAVTGSSPAYIYTLIDAMAMGGVKLGMPRAMAVQAAAQAVLGSAKMVLETGEHPCKLRDDVCSPGGTTIVAVDVLKETGYESSIIKAMTACAERNREMTSKKV